MAGISSFWAYAWKVLRDIYESRLWTADHGAPGGRSV